LRQNFQIFILKFFLNEIINQRQKSKILQATKLSKSNLPFKNSNISLSTFQFHKPKEEASLPTFEGKRLFRSKLFFSQIQELSIFSDESMPILINFTE